MATRASARLRSQDRDLDNARNQSNNKINFQKPNLPPLKGTPSSRRQYTYGSGVEPPPARPVRRGKAIDLASAIRGALTRQGDDDDEVFVQRPTAAQQTSGPLDVDEDELTESETGSQISLIKDEDFEEQSLDALDALEPPEALPHPQDYGDDESDLDDIRSFDMESDYYDGATIDSMSGTTSLSSPSSPLPPLTSDAPTATDPSARKGAVDNGTNMTFPKVDFISSKTDSIVDRREPVALATPPETDSQLSLEAEAARHPSDTISAPAQDSGMDRLGKTRTDLLGDLRRNAGPQPQGSRRQLTISPKQNKTSFFSKTSKPTNPPTSLTASHPFSHQANRDTHQAKSTGPLPSKQGRVLQRWQSLLSDEPEEEEEEEEGEEQENDDEMHWLHLVNPWPHLQTLWQECQPMLHALRNKLPHIPADVVRENLVWAGTNLIYLIAGLLALLVAVFLSRTAYENLPTDALTPGHLSIPSLSFGDWADRIGQYFPSFSRPFDDRWDDYPSLAGPDSRRLQKMEDWQRDLHREVAKMRTSDKMHEASITKLEYVMPKLVHMDLKDGKPVVAQEFWHAIRNLIHQDDSFLTLEKKGNEYDFANEKQWKSVVSRLTNDPAFASQLNLSLDNLEVKLTDKLPAFWDTWLATNDQRIVQMLGSALDKIELSGSPKELRALLDELVEKHVGKTETGAVVVTREEFLRHMKNEFAAHRAETKAEIDQLQPNFEKFVQDAIALAKDELPDGMSRAEVERLVTALVKKTIADMNLEGLAIGRIYAHWDRELKNQTNYFVIGAGATINVKLTSQTYKPDQEDINRKGIRAKDPLEPAYAILPWFDDGDCWCGARRQNKRNNPHDVSLVVQLGYSVIPQHIVVEHILPGATTDPGARPKDIEVYASIEDPIIRTRVQDFAAAHFPDDKDDWNFLSTELPPMFVKIGQFVYEDAERHDGVHVHHLSPELIALGAETDQVAIRATSNYGAKWHTCFYRVRLFGQRDESAVEPPHKSTTPSLKKRLLDRFWGS